MTQYISITGGASPVDFETAILSGRAPDNGLYVAEQLPKISIDQLIAWKSMTYTELTFEILSLFIDRSVISEQDLRELIENSFKSFSHPDVVPVDALGSNGDIFIQELFHGPTLSFKDVAMGFVVNLFNFFLKRKGERMTIMAATSGDTGPAAANACIGKETLDAWILYPPELITEEQVRQMTCITAPNVHAVSVAGCPDGSDDLEQLVADLFADKKFKAELNLSSVNSINWARVMMQTVHYFYGYFRTVDQVGEQLDFAVPCGAFGNLCAGSMARKMGLPVGKFIVATNENVCLQRVFEEGVFAKLPIVKTPSSAIDITIPLNFWRHLYYATGENPEKMKQWIGDFDKNGKVVFDSETHQALRDGFVSTSISNEETLATIKQVYEVEDYLLDPHAAVAVRAAKRLKSEPDKVKTLCLATAHPAKFPDVIAEALGFIPDKGRHASIEAAKQLKERIYSFDFEDMHKGVRQVMRNPAN